MANSVASFARDAALAAGELAWATATSIAENALAALGLQSPELPSAPSLTDLSARPHLLPQAVDHYFSANDNTREPYAALVLGMYDYAHSNPGLQLILDGQYPKQLTSDQLLEAVIHKTDPDQDDAAKQYQRERRVAAFSRFAASSLQHVGNVALQLSGHGVTVHFATMALDRIAGAAAGVAFIMATLPVGDIDVESSTDDLPVEPSTNLAPNSLHLSGHFDRLNRPFQSNPSAYGGLDEETLSALQDFLASERPDPIREPVTREYTLEKNLWLENTIFTLDCTAGFITGFWQGVWHDGVVGTVESGWAIVKFALWQSGPGIIVDYIGAGFGAWDYKHVRAWNNVVNAANAAQKYGPYAAALIADLSKLNLMIAREAINGRAITPYQVSSALSQESLFVLGIAQPVIQEALDSISAKLAAMSTEERAHLVGRVTGVILFEIALGLATEGAVTAAKAGTLPIKLKALGFSEKVVQAVVTKADEVVEAARAAERVQNHGLLKSAFQKNIKRYLDVIESHTGFKLHPTQRARLIDDLRTNSYTRLSPENGKLHQRGFTQRVTNAQIAEWERQTGQAWPRYTQDLRNAEGIILRKAGDPFDAHHIIENVYGGPHEWWNLTPARFPNQHQGGIHLESVMDDLFP